MSTRKICGKRYRVLIDGWKWSGTRHCTYRKGHKCPHGKSQRRKPWGEATKD